MVGIAVVSKDKFEKILMFSALFIISALFLFPLGDAKADNIVAIDADKTITFDASSAGGSVVYKIEATSAVGDTPGCNTGPTQTPVTVNLYVEGSPLSASSVPSASITSPPPSSLPISFTNCKQQRTVTFTSAAAGTYVVTAVVATGGGSYQTESATMTVIVLQNDITPPTVTVPPNITGVEATSPTGATVTFESSAFDLVSGPLPTTCIPASGFTFPLGTTPVTCSATDGAGNTGYASFNVTVVDTMVPQIFVPAGPLRVLGSINSDSANKDVGYLVTATDIADPAPGIVCSDNGTGPATVTTTTGNFPIGKTTVTCTATDTAGLTASGSFDVLIGRTLITTPTPLEIKWDKTFNVSVLTHGFESDDTIEIRRADNSAVLGSLIGNVTPLSGNPDGETFTVSGLTLPKADSNTSVGLVAVLVDNPDVASSSTFPISVLKHVTSLSLDPISDTVVTTAYGTRGALKDVDASGAGIPGQAITFAGSGVTTGVNGLLQPVTTAGVLITGPGKITFCPTDPCSPNPGSVGGVNVLHLFTGAKITFPPRSVAATLTLQDMLGNSFKVKVTDALGNSEEITDSGTLGYLKYFTPAVFGGVAEIEVLENDPITGIGISAITLADPDTQPETLLQLDFDAETAPLDIVAGGTILEKGGNYFSTGFVQSTEALGLQVTAYYAGNIAYEPTNSDLVLYTALNSQLGTVGEPTTTSVSPRQITLFTTIDCTAAGGSDPDDDGDGLCNSWDGTTAGKGVPYDVTCSGSAFCGTSTTQKRYVLDGSSQSTKDVYVEIDNMLGHRLLSGAVTNVISAFSGAPTPVALHVDYNAVGGSTNADEFAHNTNQASIPTTIFYAWSDSDLNSNNDFDSVKAKLFGKASERPTLGGTQSFSLPSSNTIRAASGLTVAMPAEDTDGKIILKQTISLGTGCTSATIIPKPTAPGTPSPVSGIVEYRTPDATVSSSGLTRLVITVIPFTAESGSTITLPQLDTVVVPPGCTMSLTGAQIFVTTSKLQARAMAYHYGLDVHSVGLCGPSGVSEQYGNDFIISLGCDFTTVSAPTLEGTTYYSEPTGTGHTATTGSLNEQAGTFLHEIGHNFNLNHGGPKNLLATPTTLVSDSSINCKPNYASVMSYSRQYDTGYLGTSWILDYSRGLFTATTAPPLIENSLDENIGLESNSALTRSIIWAIPQTSGNPILKTGTTTASSALAANNNIDINWNGASTTIETGRQININNFKIPGCDDLGALPRTTAYFDYDDWANLFYNFRKSTAGTAANGNKGQGYLHASANSVSEQNGATSTTIANNADSFLGFLSPINMDGSSSLKAGSSTNPFKFKKTTGGANPVSDPSLVATLVMKGTDYPTAKCAAGKGLSPGVIKTTPPPGAQNNIPFVYDSASETYKANLQTKGYSIGVYGASVVLANGVILTSLDFSSYTGNTGDFTVPICITK